MKAILRDTYGGPEVLYLGEADKPEPKPDEILVRIKNISVNPLEWHILRGEPYFARASFGLFKPKHKILGSDFSGTVEAVGNNITDYKPGDHVFGDAMLGSFAEFNAMGKEKLAKKPEEVSFESAGCVGVAGMTALQGVRDHGQVKSGERVLINGCSGGVGHLTVQMAKVYGAKVTGVCSARNRAMMLELGADEIIDYNAVNIHEIESNYDVVMDIHGNLSYADFKRLGSADGRGVLIGFTTMKNMLNVLRGMAFGKFPIKQFTAKANNKDFVEIGNLMASGQLKVQIDRTFPFEKTAEAIAFIEEMHTSGKVSIEVP